MGQDILASGETDARQSTKRNKLRAAIKFGSFEANLQVDVTSVGLLAIGGLVSAILLSVVPIVHAATRKIPPPD
jgi:hypothetical protein